jgi:hypothetical protein
MSMSMKPCSGWHTTMPWRTSSAGAREAVGGWAVSGTGIGHGWSSSSGSLGGWAADY